MDSTKIQLPKRKFCFWCIVRSLEEKLIGFRLFTGECHHFTDQSYTIYKISKILVIRHLVMTLATIYFIYCLISKLIQFGDFLYFYSRLEIVILLLPISSLLVFFQIPFAIQTRIRVIQLINYIVDMLNDCGTQVYTEADVVRLRKGYRKLGYLLVAALLLASIFLSIGLFFNKTQLFIESCVILLGGWHLLSGNLLSFVIMHTVKNVYCKGIYELKKNLSHVMDSQKAVSPHSFKELNVQLKKFIRAYNRSTAVLELMTSFIGLPALLAIFGYIIYMVTSCSLLGEWLININLTQNQVIVMYIMNIVGIIGIALLYGVIIFANSLTDPVR